MKLLQLIKMYLNETYCSVWVGQHLAFPINDDLKQRNALLTLRLLMSYIYMEHLFLMFLDHTRRRTTVGRTPLDE